MTADRRTATPVLVCGEAALPLAAKVWACHQQVFGDDPDRATWHEDLFERHVRRERHRLAVFLDSGTVTGYGWGYVGHRGEYWADLLGDALPAEVASAWVGGHFDLVELAVLATHRRRGLGQALHDCLLAGLSGRCLLSTSSDPDDPAVRLYRRSGWTSLGTLRPGRQVMGLDLDEARGSSPASG